MMDDKSNPENGGKESPGEKLRKILRSKKKEQTIEPINGGMMGGKGPDANRNDILKKFAADKSEIQAAADELSDTQRIFGIEDTIEVEPFEFRQRVKVFLSSIIEKISWAARSSLDMLSGLFKRGKGKRRFFRRMRENPQGCLVAGTLMGVFGTIIVGILALSFLIVQYFTIAAGLPSVENLRQYASQFETTRIYDRNGNLIYEILDPNAGRRTYVSLDEISPEVIAATIATEDKDFYSNPGFDPLGILRAFWQNYTSGKVVSGASTITQQLARTLLLSPEERVEISTRRKTREIVLAAEITRKYSKDEILELYINEIYFGNLAYGIQAAAETYFNTISAAPSGCAQFDVPTE